MDALDVLEKTADAQLVSADDLNGWIRALNSVRILLGTRLGIDADEDDGQELAADHPQIAEWAIYYFLTALQGDVVEALTGSLAPPWNDD